MSDARYVYVSAEVGGVQITVARRNLECEEVDQYLFDEDYTIAGSTGFLLWPGTWVILELLRGVQPEAPQLTDRIRGKRVVELGSGTGLAGLCAASAGAHMLLTDLPSVVEGILIGNVARNKFSPEAAAASAASPASGPWQGAAPVGPHGGTAACLPLDWSRPLQGQLDTALQKRGLDLSTADMLLAVDVVWLKELLIPFRDTVLGLLQQCRPGTPFLLTFIDRAKDASGQFSSRNEVAELFTSRGCKSMLYHSQTVEVDGETMQADVIEITGPLHQ